MSVMDEGDSACSTPYVSAPSSPGRHSSGSGAGGFFFSAPASPLHFILPSLSSAEFDFSARFPSADELFLNGQIRPMKLSTHLQRPQILAPLIDLDEPEVDLQNASGIQEKELPRGHRRTRSMSPLRTDTDMIEEKDEVVKEEVAMSASSSRSSSSMSRSSKRWIFLKEFLLYRSKSEGGRSDSHKFWNNLSFSPVKDKKATPPPAAAAGGASSVSEPKKKKKKKTNGVGKRRVPASAHEIHYKVNRAQAEEMRKKTFLPYREGLIGCLGFSSKSYGAAAVNGLAARALNPVPSRWRGTYEFIKIMNELEKDILAQIMEMMKVKLTG